MAVILNRFKGDHFENPDCKCDQCGAVGTVAVLNKYIYYPWRSIEAVHFCLVCLNKAQLEINAAVLADASREGDA